MLGEWRGQSQIATTMLPCRASNPIIECSSSHQRPPIQAAGATRWRPSADLVGSKQPAGTPRRLRHQAAPDLMKSSSGGETFRQVPINTLMDHNDDIRRVCDDFTRALKIHAVEEERLGGHIHRALRGASNGLVPSGDDAPPGSPSPALAAATGAGAGTAAPPSSKGDMTSIDAALLAFQGFLSSLAQAHAGYARSLTDEIRRPVQASLAEQQQQHARLKLEWNRVVQEYYARREALGKAKNAVGKAAHDHEAACALYEAAVERRSVSMASFTSDLHTVRQRCDRALLQRAQAEKAEREARAELYEAVGERDDFVRRAARAYQEMEGRRLLGLKQAMLAAAKAEKAHCQMRMQEAEALERAAAAVDVERDMARMAARHKDPEATHAYARALVILDWGWRRQQQQQRRRLVEEAGRRREEEEEQRREQQRSLSASSVRRSASTELEMATGGSNPSNGNGSSGSSEPLSPAAEAREGGEKEGEVGVMRSGIDAVLERLLLLSPANEDEGTAAAASTAPFEELVESEEGRAYFLRQLNDQRGRGTGDVGDGYGGLARCFQLLLDKCQAAHDVRAAQQALALANTFFRESQQQQQQSQEAAGQEEQEAAGEDAGSKREREREYLLPLVRAHPVWRDRRLWEDSLMLSVGDQLDLCPETRPWEELSGESLKEQVLRVHNLIFAQLASLALHMRECGVAGEEVKGFVRTMAERTQLGEEQRTALENEMATWAEE